MGLFFVYAVKASVCLAGFYLFYRLLLSKETFHRFNRVALLGLLAFSCLTPLIEVTTQEVSEVNQSFLSLEEMLMMADLSSEVVVEEEASFPWRELLLLVYIAGIFFFLIRHLWSLSKMVRLLRSARKEVLEDGIILYVHQKKEVAPFSWMRCIAISESDWKESGETVLTHERAHIQNHHSWDLLLAEACIFFQWFNPAAWLLKQELQNIHEYEADEWVINQGIDAKKYQLLIIKKAVGARLYSIANSFNHSSLKKRITMMIKKKSNPWARVKYLYVLPLAAVAVAAFARPEVSNELNEILSVKVNDLTSIVKAEEVKSVEFSSDEKFKVTGTVVEAERKNVPVMGASIIVRGTTKGTLTDIDGNFELSDVKVGDVIMVSFVGYQTQLVVVKDTTPLVVQMTEKVQTLDEMVVVGYENSSEENKADADKKETEESTTQEPQEKVIFQVVEEMPEFPGGMAEAMKFLSKNIKYPSVAQKAKIEGRVIVQFVVEKDGSVSDVKTVRSVSPELDAEAIRVVNMMPKWTPGKQRGKAVAVKFTMPIMFRLDTLKDNAVTQKVSMKVEQGVKRETVDEAKNLLKIKGTVVDVRTPNDKKPLVVVDGKVQENGEETMKNLSAESIESMTVLKDKSAMELYGDKGKDGVIIITTKKN
ncbi:MAG: TonB family protein [Bacteroidaceae bacterium]|nr:TonB family protein [Bacteroidaceae bacterium]